MITNMYRGDIQNKPLFRLERESHTIHWIRGTAAKRLIADALIKLYPEGVGVCSDTCRLMGYVLPGGRVIDIPQPWPYKPIHVMVNNPEPSLDESSPTACPCMGFVDPEVGGPWRLRGLREHHPLCMYREGAMRRYVHFVNLGTSKIRPDAWFRSLKEIVA